MVDKKFKIFRYAGILLSVFALCSFLLFPWQSSKSAASEFSDAKSQVQSVQAENASEKQSTILSKLLNECNTSTVSKNAKLFDLLSPTASLCINGSLAVADPDYNRVLASSTGTGFGNGTVGNCSLSGTATATNYDAYSLNLTGCAAFPTEVTITLCGPAGCQHIGNVDTVVTLYRNVTAGDPLTGNNGLSNVFNPASPCTNARAAQDDLGTTSGTTNNPGGSTCNQVNTANCVAPCTSPTNAGGLSGMRRQLGSGLFQVVVAGFSNATTGNYNLYVNAPAAGCLVSLVPTASAVSVGGRVMTSYGRGVANARVTMTDSMGVVKIAFVNPFGFYRFEDVRAGETYTFGVSHKLHKFEQPTQVLSVVNGLDDINFTVSK